ncbi:toxin-antitoxin system, toxin component, MazF family protein [Fructobacillus sp. M2-14]|uniref:Toxin-antitoxin system, toxin component, MazF family protein n=1 Tax=Fructobacillus broussonetiae TaxID=2713173 RepID=A0ABS5QZF2_9LACO|nr:type II toxin-antitoxin system PemK/MazF family toxin [Fructobacillus broussonetiae]MBS9338147.1 toxin-antitoxin system, toxin component, MazF family protein [Fructobacillus broussonetiae]
MKTGEIVSAFIVFEKSQDGKRRPALILLVDRIYVFVFRITSKYKNKSKRIKKVYFELLEWKQASLTKHSYVDTGRLIPLKQNLVKRPIRSIGVISQMDLDRLLAFLNITPNKKAPSS